jgi:glyoxylase-like metal-dependent hydrolase (beta-lactamase superfamily II)
VLLDALGDERPAALLLTHIHFDHAGVAGSLVQRRLICRSTSTSAAPHMA